MFWMLTREILRLRGSIGRRAWDIKPDLFLHKEEETLQQKAKRAGEEASATGTEKGQQQQQNESLPVVAHEDDSKLFNEDVDK